VHFLALTQEGTALAAGEAGLNARLLSLSS